MVIIKAVWGVCVDDLTVILIVVGAFFALSLIVRLFNQLSGFKRLKLEREAFQKEKQCFEQEKSSTESRYHTEMQELSDRKSHLDQAEVALAKRISSLRILEGRVNDTIREKTISLAKDIASRNYLSETPVFAALASDTIPYDRLLSSLTGGMRIMSPFDISAIIQSGSEVYKTSLYHCSCPDYQFRKQPCKHMMRLGLEVGMLIGLDKQPLHDEFAFLIENRQSITREKADLIQKRQLLNRLECTQDQSYVWLAKLRTEAYEVADEKYIDYLLNKSRPATQTAAEISKIVHGELRQARLTAKQLEYQLHFYESIFPWLEDYKEVPPLEALAYEQRAADVSQDEDSQSQYRTYISQKEWFDLSESDRYQLILDRYIARNKSNWEIGIEYERYIGYLCEQRGYKVIYNGARRGLEDMGRDLILEGKESTVLIQCKRWAEYKTVHENHVFQLAGSVFEYQHQHPFETVIGVLVTSTTLSDIASRCAGYLGIKVFENIPFQEYPRIKCNIGKGGQKIYHLPVDQQYDTAIIDSPGEFYATTVAEAEASGFRRAYRWHSKRDPQ